jgi:hypothetical protein
MMRELLLVRGLRRGFSCIESSLLGVNRTGYLDMARDFAEVERELEKIVSLLRRTKEVDQLPRQMLLTELSLLLEELERLNGEATD